MKITVDTSVLLAVCANEPGKDRLIALAEGCQLIAPASVHWEIGNALSAMLKRSRVSLDQANSIVSAYSSIPIQFVDVDLSSALTLVERFRMYAYDAYLLVCAVVYKTPILTLDAALKSAARELGIHVLGDE